jgi:hypothetical protein
MSVTLRYRGTLNDLSRLTELQNEFQDIAAAQAWPCDLLERGVSEQDRGRVLAPPLALRGVKLTVHPQTDPLWFTFDEQGVLTRLGSFSLGLPSAPGVAGSQRFGFLHQSQASIQTSIGGSELHLTVVGLLDYLKRVYVQDLTVSDDTGYWDSRDKGALCALMDAPRR